MSGPGLVIDHGAWVLVGDGRKALFFRNEGDATYPNLQVVEMLRQDNPPTHEQGTDRPGRSFSSTSPRRSGMEQTDWHQIEEHRFARTIADALHAAAQDGRFSKLIVVAPPITLGDLRKAFHKDVSSRIVAEIDKDLTKHASDQIEKLLTAK